MKPINVDSIPSGKLFSICTLVTDFQEYNEMVNSFQAAGFTDEFVDFYFVDNSNGNSYDGYQGLNAFLSKVTGQYIIICHQDVLLTNDGMQDLINRIQELNSIDPAWAILGNAGYRDLNRKAIRISDPYGANVSIGPFPAKVESLDENFLVIRKSANLTLSHDLNGFHFYGLDLCLIADLLGYNAYVIDFHLYHKSGGNCNESFFLAKSRIIDKYQRVLRNRFVRTTCATLFLSSSQLLNFLMNRKLVYSLKKRFDFINAKFS